MYSIADGFNKAFRALFGSRNDRLLNEMQPIVKDINALEEKVSALSQDQLIKRTRELQEQIKQKYQPINSNEYLNKQKKTEQKNEVLDEFLPEAYAMVREAAKRTTGMRPFDVQIMGGIAMHQGKIAEMCTGEGKTLAATLPAYLNALSGEPVHIITVNDYLAQRDRDWMGPILEYLGLKVGAIKADMDSNDKRKAYACDVTYGTNSEFGFDHLRDNMEVFKRNQVQRGFGFAIVDEVDNVLIDEARTPLIISRQDNVPDADYKIARDVAEKLDLGEIIKNRKWFENNEEIHTGDYVLKEKEKHIILTEEGEEKAEKELEKILGTKIDFYLNKKDFFWKHLIQQALNAKHFWHNNREYLIVKDEAVIVDEFTGRLMPGRRWSEGLHQAIEAKHEKEGVKIQAETKTAATITLQHLFQLYDKLAGMTGTAITEAEEFDKVYGLETVSIPTNKPLIRKDLEDRVYLTQEEKWNAIVQEIEKVHETGQPILIGTRDVKNSEYLSQRLEEIGISHTVLNAKNHAKEAQIIAGAGKKGAVTIATNMAGRGTDIELGGKKQPTKEWQEEHNEVVNLGGLYVLGTERHEARRIDNQLRGRSGRQGDPGQSRFIVSLEDDLMRLFIPSWMRKGFEGLGMGNGEELEGGQVTRAIARAQKNVENNNFQARKNLMEYDEILNAQRKCIYEMRQQAVEKNDNLKDLVLGFFNEKIQDTVDSTNGKYTPITKCMRDFGLKIKPKDLQKIPRSEWTRFLQDIIRKKYEKKEGSENGALKDMEKIMIISEIDKRWPQHLYLMEMVKHNIGLRGYAQIDPKIEYKKEGLALFNELMVEMADSITGKFFRVTSESPITHLFPKAEEQKEDSIELEKDE